MKTFCNSKNMKSRVMFSVFCLLSTIEYYFNGLKYGLKYEVS